MRAARLQQLMAAGRLSPGSGAVVMGTGIVSVALHLDGVGAASEVLLAISAIIWIALGLVLCWRVFADLRGFITEAHSPAGLTGVAATAVLGTRAVFAGSATLAGGLLVLGSLAWAVLGALAMRGIRLSRRGEAFMVTVAPQGLATLAAMLAFDQHAAWLTLLALGFAVIGLALYPLALIRFDLTTLRSGGGDQWVAGGSLAISALAFSEVAVAARHTSLLASVAGGLRICALVVWIVAIAWLVVLAASELCWRRLHYNASRWSTVFPLGMYAVCSFSVARTSGAPGLATFARVWIWIAVAVWVAVFAGMTRSGMRPAAAGPEKNQACANAGSTSATGRGRPR